METIVTSITAEVDWAAVGTGIGVVAGGLAGIYVIMKGARMLLGMIRR